jgi:predicted RNase H-like HicB family nuclease
MKKIRLKNIVWKEGKYYVSQCLNLGISSFGETRKEALENLEEALELYFEDNKNPEIAKIERPKIVEKSFCHA